MQSDKDKEPVVVISDHIKDEMARDPELAEAMEEFSRMAIEAMEGIKSGKFPSFDVAMEFLSGNKPERVHWDEGRQDYVDDEGRGTYDRDANDNDPEPN